MFGQPSGAQQPTPQTPPVVVVDHGSGGWSASAIRRMIAAMRRDTKRAEPKVLFLSFHADGESSASASLTGSALLAFSATARSGLSAKITGAAKVRCRIRGNSMAESDINGEWSLTDDEFSIALLTALD